MDDLTERQRQILSFIQDRQAEVGHSPSLREIAAHFGFRSMTAARDHVRALEQKGALRAAPRTARALTILKPAFPRAVTGVAEVPIYGRIAAGFADVREQENEGSIRVDSSVLGIKPTSRTFALKVRGDSMVGRHILDGDVVIVEAGVAPREGDVVAALIDHESTLKTFARMNGRAFLKAENPRYPDLIPAEELSIQGVMVGLIRKS